MHHIKKVAEVQNYGQAELQSSRLEDKLTLQSEWPQHFRRLGKSHKAEDTPQSQRPEVNEEIQL